MKKQICLILLSCLLLAGAGCGPSNAESAPPAERDASKLNLGAISPDDSFSLRGENVNYFTLGDAGTIFAVTDQRKLAEFNRNGELLDEYENAGTLTNICYSEQIIYAYDVEQDCLVAYDLTNKSKSSVSDAFGMDILEIKDLSIAGNTAFIHLVPRPEADKDGEYPFDDSDENGYIDFGEKLYLADLKEGKVTDTKIEHVISTYTDTTGKLYYYAYLNETYVLYNLDAQTMKSHKVADMNDAGYVLAFVCEAGNFTYIDSGRELRNKRLSDGAIFLIKQEIWSGTGSNTALYAGHFVYRNLPVYNHDFELTSPAYINSVYIGYIYETESSPDATTGESAGSKTSSITVSNTYGNPFDADFLYQKTKLFTRYLPPNYDDTLLLTELMAGDPGVDIYLFSSDDYVAAALKKMGYYVPLNDNAAISDYAEGCFDTITDFMTNGDELWGVPLSINTTGIVYVPKNFTSMGLTYGDVATFDSYFATLEQLQSNDGGYLYYPGLALNFGGEAVQYYETFHNDYANKLVDFNTDLFRNIFTKSFDGWDASLGFAKPGGNHPLFRAALDHVIYTDENHNEQVYAPEYDADKMLFKYGLIWDALDYTIWDTGAAYSLDDWGVFPFPKVSDAVTGNHIWFSFAMVNPHSENIKEAILYLEAITENPHDTITAPCFVRQDLSFYEGEYDMSLTYFKDVYNILSNGTLRRNYAPRSDAYYMNDYQLGRESIDGVIALMQREMEMALDE